MLNFIQLIQNENMKIYKRIGTWVMIALLAVGIIIVGIVTKFIVQDHDTNWVTELQAENQYMKEQIDKVGGMGLNVDALEQRVAVNQYRLEHHIPPVESKTLWGFTIDVTNLTSVAALFTIVIAGGIVASEFSWGTIKLLLIRPVSRTKVLLAKFTSTLLFALLLLGIMFVFSILVGGILFGFNAGNLPYLAYVNGEVIEKNMVSHVISLYGLKSVDLLMMVTFAFMISTVFRSSSLAIGLALFLMFTGQQVVQLLSQYEWAKYLLFANTNLIQYINGTPLVEGMTMGFSISVLLVYFLMFMLLSLFIFNKRDVIV